MFEKRVIIDCRGHLLGRLAATIAKELLAGQHIVAVRTEGIVISGPLARNKLKFLSFLKKHVNTNPRRGPFHFRAPSKMLWRAVRGMLPHKTARGAAALAHLKVFEGVPPPYDKVKRMVVPQALKALQLDPHRRVTILGELAQQVGWKYSNIVAKLEDKRKIRATANYQRKKALAKLRRQAANDVKSKVATQSALLQGYGYLSQ